MILIDIKTTHDHALAPHTTRTRSRQSLTFFHRREARDPDASRDRDQAKSPHVDAMHRLLPTQTASMQSAGRAHTTSARHRTASQHMAPLRYEQRRRHAGGMLRTCLTRPHGTGSTHMRLRTSFNVDIVKRALAAEACTAQARVHQVSSSKHQQGAHAPARSP